MATTEKRATSYEERMRNLQAQADRIDAKVQKLLELRLAKGVTR